MKTLASESLPSLSRCAKKAASWYHGFPLHMSNDQCTQLEDTGENLPDLEVPVETTSAATHPSSPATTRVNSDLWGLLVSRAASIGVRMFWWMASKPWCLLAKENSWPTMWNLASVVTFWRRRSSLLDATPPRKIGAKMFVTASVESPSDTFPCCAIVRGGWYGIWLWCLRMMIWCIMQSDVFLLFCNGGIWNEVKSQWFLRLGDGGKLYCTASGAGNLFGFYVPDVLLDAEAGYRRH